MFEPATGAYVVQFTADLPDHEANLWRLVSPGAKLEFRKVALTVRELHSRRTRVVRDVAWLDDLHAWYDGSAVDISGNRVKLYLSSKNLGLEQAAMARYQGDGWLVVEVDGNRRWEGAFGRAQIDVADANGAPALHLPCVLIPDDPAAAITESYTTGFDGRCSLDQVPATAYRVEIQWRADDLSPWETVGVGRIVVPPGGVGSTHVEVALPN